MREYGHSTRFAVSDLYNFLMLSQFISCRLKLKRRAAALFLRHHSVVRAVCRAWAGCRCRRRGARQVRHGATIPIPTPASTSTPPIFPTRLFSDNALSVCSLPFAFLSLVATLSRCYGWIKAMRALARFEPTPCECLSARSYRVIGAVYRGVAPIPLVSLRFVIKLTRFFSCFFALSAVYSAPAS